MACGACVSSIGSNVVDLSVTVMTELVDIMRKDKILNEDESKSLRTIVTTIKGGTAIINASDKLAKAMEAVKYVSEITIEHNGIKAVIGNSADQVNKANILIKIMK